MPPKDSTSCCATINLSYREVILEALVVRKDLDYEDHVFQRIYILSGCFEERIPCRM
jgi:hypothetical protein